MPEDSARRDSKTYRSIAEWEQPLRAVVKIKDGKPYLTRVVEWGELRDLRKTGG